MRHGIRNAGRELQDAGAENAADQRRGGVAAFLPLAMQEAAQQADIEGVIGSIWLCERFEL